jgi:hypothetical protein
VKIELRLSRWLFSLAWLAFAMLAQAASPASDYAVVVSRSTQADAGWREVVEALRQKHAAAVFTYETNVDETLPALRELFPRYACFVARPQEATREFVARVHRLTRRLDDDPYPDCFWGILTGFDAANALRIAKCQQPLTIRKAAAGTPIPLQLCEEGVWYSELDAGKTMKKETGGEPKESKVPADTTEAVAKALNEYQADLFITSGHATEHDWQMGYRYRNGQFRCENGVLYGLDTQGHKHPVHSPNPKVYMPVGNCLMGHIDGTNAMALAFLNSGGVNQMLGYTVTTWYGYAGWGCLDYFLEQPGRFTFAEAFLANQAALVYRLQTYFPDLVNVATDRGGNPSAAVKVGEGAKAAGLTAQDGSGLVYDRDVLAFYGDPAWEARLAAGPTAWKQTLKEDKGVWTFEIQPQLGEKTFEPLDTNGSQRGGRPIIQFFPRRLTNIEVTKGAELKPVVTKNFILVPNPRQCDPAKKYVVEFKAKASS